MSLNSFRSKWNSGVQAIIEDSIMRRPHDPSVPNILRPQPTSIFIKLLLWFKARSARAMDVRIVVEKSDSDTGYLWTRRKGGVLEAHVMRRKTLSAKEEAELKNLVRNQYAELYNANPLTRRDKLVLWLVILGTVGGVIALLVWNHVLHAAGVAR